MHRITNNTERKLPVLTEGGWFMLEPGTEQTLPVSAGVADDLSKQDGVEIEAVG